MHVSDTLLSSVYEGQITSLNSVCDFRNFSSCAIFQTCEYLVIDRGRNRGDRRGTCPPTFYTFVLKSPILGYKVALACIRGCPLNACAPHFFFNASYVLIVIPFESTRLVLQICSNACELTFGMGIATNREAPACSFRHAFLSSTTLCLHYFLVIFCNFRDVCHYGLFLSFFWDSVKKISKNDAMKIDSDIIPISVACPPYFEEGSIVMIYRRKPAEL